MYKFPVISDSHVGDRLSSLPTPLLETLNRGKYDFICHTGDISVERVLGQLNEIAPTIAVKGDADHRIRGLRQFEKIVVDRKTIILTHGDRPWRKEYPSKVVNKALGYLGLGLRWWNGYAQDLYKSFISERPDIIFCGHLHKSFIERQNDTLVINPGAVYVTGRGVQHGFLPSFAILTIDQSISVEFISLELCTHLVRAKLKVVTSYAR